MFRLALTPRWIAGFLFALVLVTVFVGLSMWQVDRAQHKNDAMNSAELSQVKPLAELVEAQVPMSNELSDQMVKAHGSFLDMQVIVPGRTHNGTAGYWVVTMFEVTGARLGADAQELNANNKPIAIPVVRGWAPDAQTARASVAPTGEKTIVARMGPTEGPVPAVGQLEVQTVSTAQLVNFFEVYSFGGILFPDAASAPLVADDLEAVGLEPQEDGGWDLQSAFYALEWLVFAVFALYIWWRMLRDAHEKQRVAQLGRTDYVVVKKPGQASRPASQSSKLKTEPPAQQTDTHQSNGQQASAERNQQ